MINQTSKNSASDERQNLLDVISTQLRSQTPSTIWKGFEQVRQLLDINPEDQDVYALLLDVSADSTNLREQVHSLISEKTKSGSKSAKSALKNLPASVEELLSDANDLLRLGEYDDASGLYKKALKLEPNNETAEAGLIKLETARMAVSTNRDVPSAALQYYRRSRSYIAARDYKTAIDLLNAAIEVAQEKNMSYPDAEVSLNDIQNLLLAENYKEKARLALEKNRKNEALDYYNKSINLDTTNESIKKELESIQSLLQSEAIFEKKGFLSLITPNNQLQNGLDNVKLILGDNNSFVKSIERKLNKIKFIQTGTIIILIILASLFLTRHEIIELIQYSTSTPTIIYSTAEPTLTPTDISTPTTKPTTKTPTLTSTTTPVVTDTLSATPIQSILGYGKLIHGFFALDAPNGKRVQALSEKQLLIVLEVKNDHGDIWYKCQWDVGGIIGEGWIIGEAIQFVPPPTPTLAP